MSSATDERERLLAEIVSHVAQGIVVWNLDDPGDDLSLRLVFANRAAEVHSGLSLLDSIGKRVSDVFPTAQEVYARAIGAVARERKSLTFAQVTRGKSLGKESNFSVTIVPVLEHGALALTENLNVSTLHKFLDSIIEHIPAMIFIKDAKHLRFERFNRAGEELLGLPREQLIGKTDYDLFPREQADFFVAKDRAVLREKRLEDVVEEPIKTPHGLRWLHTKKIPLLDDRGEPAHLLGISLDITERKRAEEVLRTSHEELEQRITERTAALRKEIDERMRTQQALTRTEEQLRQTQKMEAIGRLAGGIAHDFNNLLSVVLTYSRLLAPRFPEGGELRSWLVEIQRAAQRAAELTRQLLAYSRQQVLQPATLDLNEVLSGMRDMLTRLVGEDVELQMDLDPTLDEVKSDPNQFEQVMMNLVVNARDAMPNGGRLVIETRNVELDSSYAESHAGAHPGRHVRVSVSDTGIGMDRHTMARIFDPFFTTKEKDKGTGLGLSMVHGSVRQSGGWVAVESAPERGATFRLHLPAVEPGQKPQREAPSPSTRPRSGSETILLVEDDEQVRTIVAMVLRSHGYKVIAAARPSEALDAVENEAGRIDLLLTDVVMPEMNGRTLAEEVTRKRRNVSVIFMSGYTDDAIVRHGVREASVAFIQKPLTPELLTRRVREVLDAAPARASDQPDGHDAP